MYWLNEFNRRRTSVFDEECSGCPIEVATRNMVNKSRYRVSILLHFIINFNSKEIKRKQALPSLQSHK